MKKIEIPFNSWSRSRLNNFTKNATSRNTRYGEPRDVFELENKRYEIVFVVRLPLWFIAKHLHVTEGCFNENEFIEVWRDIHPKAGWTPNKIVYYHYFKCIGGGL